MSNSEDARTAIEFYACRGVMLWRSKDESQD